MYMFPYIYIYIFILANTHVSLLLSIHTVITTYVCEEAYIMLLSILPIIHEN